MKEINCESCGDIVPPQFESKDKELLLCDKCYEVIENCNHQCTSDCRKEGCNCECGEYHITK